MTDTPTPRTDAEEFNHEEDGISPHLVVNGRFARILERELSAMTEFRDSAVANFDADRKANDALIRQLREDLMAANARIAELEELINKLLPLCEEVKFPGASAARTAQELMDALLVFLKKGGESEG